MPLWGRTDDANSAPKYTVDVYGNSGTEQYGNTVFLVDVAEARVKGISPGWVRKIDRGNGRISYETLIAFSGPELITTDGNDDAEFPDFVSFTITSEPTNESANTGDSIEFSFEYNVAPTDAQLNIVWQESSDLGNTYYDLTETYPYQGTGTSTLRIADVTGLDTYVYRAEITAEGNTAFTASATLTVS